MPITSTLMYASGAKSEDTMAVWVWKMDESFNVADPVELSVASN